MQTITMAHMITVKSTAYAIYPTPEISPEHIAIKIMLISLALPCAERKRTRPNAPDTATPERKRTSENAPAVATPTPMLPFTIIMTTDTTAGSMISAVRKLPLARFLKEYAPKYISPVTSAAPTHKRKLRTRTVSPVSAEKILPNRSSIDLTSPYTFIFEFH